MSSSLFYGQDSSSIKKIEHRLESNFSLTKFDIFHSFEYSLRKNRFQTNFGLGYGINKTFFQQRFFPRLNVTGVYNLVSKPKFTFGPSLNYHFSWLKINRESSRFNNWNELFGGIHWEYGQKWKIGQTIAAGYFIESYYNQFLNKRDHASNWGYFIHFSLIHEI